MRPRAFSNNPTGRYIPARLVGGNAVSAIRGCQVGDRGYHRIYDALGAGAAEPQSQRKREEEA